MNEWKHMYRVKVVWLTENEGGRRSAPPIGRYYPVSRFPEEKTDWQNNAWSVVFELEKPCSGKPDPFRGNALIIIFIIFYINRNIYDNNILLKLFITMLIA